MINLKIYSPDGVVYESEQVNGVMLPTTQGIISVYPEHEPIIAVMAPGQIIVEKTDHEYILAVSGGILNIERESEVYILADTAERAENIDVERAEEARARAEEFLRKAEEAEDVDFSRLQGKISKELSRLDAVRMFKTNSKRTPLDVHVEETD